MLNLLLPYSIILDKSRPGSRHRPASAVPVARYTGATESNFGVCRYSDDRNRVVVSDATLEFGIFFFFFNMTQTRPATGSNNRDGSSCSPVHLARTAFSRFVCTILCTIPMAWGLGSLTRSDLICLFAGAQCRSRARTDREGVQVR